MLVKIFAVSRVKPVAGVALLRAEEGAPARPDGAFAGLGGLVRVQERGGLLTLLRTLELAGIQPKTVPGAAVEAQKIEPHHGHGLLALGAGAMLAAVGELDELDAVAALGGDETGQGRLVKPQPMAVGAALHRQAFGLASDAAGTADHAGRGLGFTKHGHGLARLTRL